MTLKTLMIGTAAAALLSGAALAQTETTDDAATAQDNQTTEMVQAEPNAEAGGEETMEMAEEPAAEGEMAEDGMDSQMAEDAPEGMMVPEGTGAGTGTDMAEDAPMDGMMSPYGTQTDMADGPATDGTMDGMQGVTSLAEMTVGDMLGLVVYALDDQRIGEIDYVVNAQSGLEAVIGIGGFLGLGEYTVALPLEEFQLAELGDRLVLPTDKEALKQRPEFDETGVTGLDNDVRLSDYMTRN